MKGLIQIKKKICIDFETGASAIYLLIGFRKF